MAVKKSSGEAGRDCQPGDVSRYPVALVKQEGKTERMEARELLRERRLELAVNGQTVARLVCTAGDLENLAVGRLVTEQIISEASDIERFDLCAEGARAEIALKEHVKRRCGPLPPARWKPEWILNLAAAFAEDSRLHRSTGGTHACILGMEGRILYRAEDISRHNAVDKAVGYAARERLDRAKCMLFTTGRVPVDMVQKSIAAGIPVLVSKSVPTADAVEMAREYGLHLFCRAWPDSFEVYADEII